MLEKVITYCREIILDVEPVSVITLQKTGLSFSITDLGVNFGEFKPYADIPKIYNFVNYLRTLDITVQYLKDAITTEPTNYLQNIVITQTDETVTLKANNYLSDETIKNTLTEYFIVYKHQRIDFEDEDWLENAINGLCSLEQQKLVLWASFYLIELRREKQQEIKAYQSQFQNGESYLDTEKSVKTNVGSSFTINESPIKDSEQSGITSLWGDRDSFLMKLQLFIRAKFEKLFNDFSLRTDSGVSTIIPIEKAWTPFSYVREDTLSGYTADLFQPISSTDIGSFN